MPTADSVKAKLQGLIDKANSATGETDTTVTQAVDRLIEGYGSGGGGGDSMAIARSIVDGSITEYADDIVTYVKASVFLASDIVTVKMSNVTSIDNGCFRDCIKLKNVYMPKLQKLANMFVFFNCSSLEKIHLPSLKSVAGNGHFQQCVVLREADLPELANINAIMFDNCSALDMVILRKSDGICTLANVNAFTSTPIASGTGYVYVPSALVEDYKAATNWSTYADQIRAIEDYPEITAEEEENE